MQLRYYQENCVNDINKFFKSGGLHALIEAPTGSGKTVTFTDIASKVALKHNKVLVLTDRAELLLQAGGSFKRAGLNSFFIQAGCKTVSSAFNCYIAMSQTLRRRIDDEYWIEFIKSVDLIIIDEAHKQEFNYLFESGLVDNKHVLGFTATPKRSGKMRQMAIDYEAIIPTVSVKQLIKEGYLVNDDYYGCDNPDMSNVAYDYLKGDFKESQMFKKFNSPKLYTGVVQNWLNITPNTKTLVFCVNIEHSIKTALEFKKHGIDIKFLVSNVSKPKECDPEDLGKYARYEERLRVYNLYKDNFNELSGKRGDVLKWFSDNPKTVLINAGILTTGYDEPSIETIILNRATLSTALLLQMLGRGSRPCKEVGKTHFNILDFGGNCGRLGHYSEDRLWSLWHEKIDGDGLPPIKECGFTSEGTPILNNGKKGCRKLIMASLDICPFCGFKYPDKVLSEAELQAMFYDTDQKKAIKTKRIKDMNLEELHDYWKAKGHKTAWLWRQLWYKGRKKAIHDYAVKYGWNQATIQKAIKFCEKF